MEGISWGVSLVSCTVICNQLRKRGAIEFEDPQNLSIFTNTLCSLVKHFGVNSLSIDWTKQ